MSEKNFDGYKGFKALNVESKPEDHKKLYAAWSETYDKVCIHGEITYRERLPCINILNNNNNKTTAYASYRPSNSFNRRRSSLCAGEV